MDTIVTEFGMRSTRLIPGKCEWNHDKFIEVPVFDIVTKVDPVGYWLSHSYEDMKTNCDLMKIYMLWPILMSHCDTDTLQFQPRFLETVEQSVAMTLKNYDYIEVLEDLADLFKKVANNPRLIDDLLRIGNKMETPKLKTKMSAIVEAIAWVQATGNQILFKKVMDSQECFRSQFLFTFFYQYAFLLTKMGEECCMLTDKVKKHECGKCDEECEKKKRCGNVAFEKRQYAYAVKFYTAAMQYSPHNHILFSNRALCFIRMYDYWNALSDGKKAVVLKSTWSKGHYRFCEALFLLGETERAVSSNKKAQYLCRYCPDGIRDLIQQQDKFMQDDVPLITEVKVKKNSKKKSSNGKKITAKLTSTAEIKDLRDAQSKSQDLPDKEMSAECNIHIENKGCSENMTGQQPRKGKAKGKGSDSEKTRFSDLNTETQKTPSPGPSQVDLAAMQDTIKSLIREAYEALNDKRCRNAEGIFSKLLDILKQSDLQSLHLTKLDYLVLQYGHANALLGIGQCVELARAENELKEIIQHHSKERFNCLAFYGIGNVYFKQNRFSDALNQYIKSKTMVNHKMVPGVLTWPTTSVVLEETRPEKLQVFLDNCIEECTFPPKPDAICRYEQCLSLPKAQIYFSDPDFKDFLKYRCLTPDCKGFTSHIVIFDSMAQIKCEFEDKIVKKREPQKPAAKNKLASNKINKTKYENKFERKKAIEEPVENPDDSKKQPEEAVLCEAAVTNGRRVKWEPLLAQVLKKEGLIKHGCPGCFPSFWESVCVWRIISPEKMEELDKNSNAQSSSKMKSFLTYLYKLNDRVKTRIFLYLLSLQDKHITVNLHDWLFIVNNKGLEAAVEFRDRNRERLKNIKPESVISLWNETYGKNINYMIEVSTDNLFDVLSAMSIEGFRLFLWLLEDNKHIASECDLEKELDKYFQEMDIPRGQIPKQSLDKYNNIWMNLKTKHKKKKRNQAVKPLYKLSGAVSTRSQDEDIFTEENTLSLLDPNEPFLVPDSLRGDLDEFDTLYEFALFDQSDQEMVLDSVEPIRETLYEYFAQILDEHGPLKPDDERLIGQYKDFPEETHRMVEAAGSLKNFLLQSYEFTIVEDMIALSANYNIAFTEFQEEYRLNPTAEEFKPSYSSPVYDNLDSYYATDHLDYMSSDSSATECSERPALYNDLDRNYQKFAEPYNSSRLRTFSDSELDLIDTDSFDHPVLDEDLDEVCSFSSNGPGSSSIEEDDDDCDGEDDDDATAPEINSDLSQDKSYTDQSNYIVSAKSEAQPKNIQTAIDSDQSNHIVSSKSETQPKNIQTAIESDQSNHIVSSKSEAQPKNVQTAIVSVQVDIEYSHHEVNTEPFQPYESQQGDILRMEKEHLVLTDQLQEATDKYENLQTRYRDEIAVLEEEIKTTETNKNVAKKELVYLQQAYENELKKWQQERKENQEKLKVLKNNIKTVTDSNEKYARGIEEKKKQYELYIEEFANIHCTKFENEKARLEKHIAKRELDKVDTAQRAAVAEVIVLENQNQAMLLKLQMNASTTEQSIKMLKPLAKSNPGILEQINTMESLLVKLKKKMDTLQSEFDEKIAPLKKSVNLSAAAAASASSTVNLPASAVLAESSITSRPVSSHPSPSPIKPKNPVPVKSSVKKTAPNKKAQQKVTNKPQMHPTSYSQKPKIPTPPSAKVPWATVPDRRGNGQPETKQSPSAKPTVFDRIIKDLHDIFPHYKSAELTNFIKNFRVRNNGSLSGLSHEEIISRVTEHILDFQTKNPPPPAAQMTPGPSMSNSSSSIAQPKQPWRVVTAGARNKWQNSDLESFGEDPCIICHDELKQFPVHKLDCGHYFHKHCIKTWLHTQSTCPTCREHALLPEDFPVLAGRMRTA
ncbi:E3 ubiquitin-protein ligase TTC3 isoform X2 [Dendrobates tinctorius]|uniref:E3 ubiquitin-protein ligase TTC3 isoform X2 n=1 Tax=Dendrobates tinctorius TaxID=92724 RepID=UPI003CCA1C6C